MKKLFVFFVLVSSLLILPSVTNADFTTAGNVTQINYNTIQIDNLGSGWNGCDGFWYAQVYGNDDNYSFPLAGGTLGNGLTGSLCQPISASLIQITFNWPYNFYFYPQTYKIFYSNNNNYNTAYYTNTFAVSSANPPQDTNTYTTLLSDDFTGTNGTTLTSHDNIWTLISGPEPTLLNNQLETYPESQFSVQGNISIADQCISFDAQFPINGGLYLWTRLNSSNGFFSYLGTNNSYGMYDINNGANYIASGYHQLPTSGIHNIEQCSVGSTTTLYLDDISIASGESNDNPSGTVGIYNPGSSSTPNHLDNFYFKSISHPSEDINNLINLTQSFNLQQGINNSLDAKLNAALDALSDMNQNNNQAAINALNAFISAVQAQSGNKITVEQANTLITVAQAIIESLSN